MSSYTESKIFNDIYRYFNKYSKYQCIQTCNAIKGANIYYYFRPHLEIKLISNSIVTVHHDLDDTCPSLNRILFLKRYKEAKLIVCINSYQKKLLQDWGITNTIVIPHGFNSKYLFLKKKELKRNEKLVFGFFSNYYPRLVKGEDYLLKLCRQLSSKDFHFILVGGKRKLLHNEIKNLGFTCTVYENLPYKYFNELYTRIHFLLITSKYEGGPACLPESIATGTPIITTNVGMVHDFKGSVTLLSNNLEKDIEVINSLKKNITKLSRETLDFKNKMFTWEEVISLYEEIFIRFSFNSQLSLYDKINIYIIKYQYKAFYFKKRILSFPVVIFNIIKFLLNRK